MRHFSLGCAIASLAIMALGVAPPAHANFYTLDGRFQCLDRANAVCGDPQPLPPHPPAVQQPAPAPAPVAPVAPVAVAAPARPEHFPPPPPRAEDPLHEIAARIQAEKPASSDIAWLTKAADSGNARAIELLAWCDLNAIGTPRDPVKAYLLYGAAAEAALPHASDNQALIYENDLSPEQRQQVLDLANEGVALARLSPAAR